MDLILWRHAEAEAGEPDDGRALTSKGHKQAEKMAAWLADAEAIGYWNWAVSAAIAAAGVGLHFRDWRRRAMILGVAIFLHTQNPAWANSLAGDRLIADLQSLIHPTRDSAPTR